MYHWCMSLLCLAEDHLSDMITVFYRLRCEPVSHSKYRKARADVTSCFIWRISRREYLNTRIYLLPQLRVQWDRIAGLLFALYVAIIFDVENFC